MKYQGGKSAIASTLVSYIHSYIVANNIETYIEPFVGGCNVIEHVNCRNRIGSDLNKRLIALYKHAVICMEDIPYDINADVYNDVRCNKDNGKYEDWYVGAIEFLGSFNGKGFTGGYSKTIYENGKVIRNFYQEARRALEKQKEKIKDVKFMHGDYRIHSSATGSLIYCDPPYIGTTSYGDVCKFNHKEFWDWVRMMSEKNIVLISEEQAPDDFDTLWEQNTLRSINVNDKRYATEKLFIHTSLLDEVGLDF